MASALGNLVFGLVMMVVGGMIALLVIVWEMIRHPFTVFKKVPRNGKSSAMSALHHSFGGPIASSPWCIYTLKRLWSLGTRLGYNVAWGR